MIVLHSYAHSDPDNNRMAETGSGLTERQFAKMVAPALTLTLEARGHQVRHYSGDLGKTIRRMHYDETTIMDNGARWCCVEVHFNDTPREHCVRCGAERRTGTVCPKCGAPPSIGWTWGPTAMCWLNSLHSLDLASTIIDALRDLMPWTQRLDRKKPIALPDPRYGRKAWVEDLEPPAVLVECGFAADRHFAEFIQDPAGPPAIGQCIADAICDWEIRHRDRPLDRWGA